MYMEHESLVLLSFAGRPDMFPFRDYVDLFDGAARQIDYHSVETDRNPVHPKITGIIMII